MTTLSFRFLGPPQITAHGKLLVFPTRKAVALLAYLVAEGGLQQRDKLAALLWPESDQEAARAALRNTLARIRHAFKEQTSADFTGLVVNRDTVYFQPDPDYEVDLPVLLHAYQHPAPDTLQQAASLYRGDFLESFFLEDAPDYEQWASLQRESFAHRAAAVFEWLAGLQFERGELQAAFDTATRWAAFDNLNEAAYRQLIRLHLALGNREAALNAFELCRKMLAKEFQSKPSPATQSLLDQLKIAQPLTPKPAITPPAPGLASLNLPLLGRAAEHTQLVNCFYEARQGQTRLVALQGEAGIGKTRLSQEFTRWTLAQGADLLTGQAFEAGGRLPYQPLVAALRARLERENAPDDLLADLWLTELSRLLPELRERYPDLPAPASLGESEARGLLFEAVARLFQALAAQGPLVLLLDDLQWADSATLDLLQYLGRRLAEQKAPVLLLFNLRSESLASDPALSDWLAGLERAIKLEKVTLAPFNPAITGQLVAKLIALDSSDLAEFSRWLYRETGGQPFFLLETLKALFEQKVLTAQTTGRGEAVFDLQRQAWFKEVQHSRVVAPGVREVIRARLGRLSQPAFNLLAAGAVLGHAFSFEQLCQVAGLGENDGLTGLDQLLKHSLFKEADATGRWSEPASLESAYFFNHDKIREVAYTEAGDARRRIFHRRAFQMFQASGLAWADQAHHAQLAGLPAEALRLHVKAGDNALRLFAVRDALTHYRQALTLWQQPEFRSKLGQEEARQLYLQMGRAYELNDQSAEAALTYHGLLDYAIAQNQPQAECAALTHLATLAIHSTFNLAEAQALLERALEVATRINDLDSLAETEWNFSHLALFRLDHEAGVRHGERALTVSRRIGQPDLIARSLNMLGYHEEASCAWEAALAHGQEATNLYAQLANRAMEADSLSVVVEVLFKLGNLAEAYSNNEKYRAIVEEISNEWGQIVNADKYVSILRDQGDYGASIKWAEKGLALGRKIQQPLLTTFSLVNLGHIYRVSLDYEAALQAHTEALEIMQQHSALLSNLIYMLADGLCCDYAFTGDWENAFKYAQLTDDLQNDGLFLHSGQSRWHVVEALLRKGAADQAVELNRRFKKRVGSNRRYHFIYYRMMAVLADWQGQPQEALNNLHEAEKIVEEFNLVGEKWLLDLELAKTARKCGLATQAKAHLVLAIQQAERIAAGLSQERQEKFLRRFAERVEAIRGAN